jgi:DNA-binding transcriptional ArsR family regulator
VSAGCISAGWVVYAANDTNLVSEIMKPRQLIDSNEHNLDIDALIASAQEASGFLKALAHEARLLILCLLIEEEKSVTAIEEILGLRQPAISQQLARLRADGLVETRREGKNIFYSLARPEVRAVISALHGVFCQQPRARSRAGSRPTIVHAAARAKVAERRVRSGSAKRSSR